MDDLNQQDAARNQAQLDALVPEEMVRTAVLEYLTRVWEEGDRQVKEAGGFAGPYEVVQWITLEQLQPKLAERFGAVGRVLARQIASVAGSIAASRAWFSDRTGGDLRYREREIENETAFARRELVRAWHDALVIAATQENIPSNGTFVLDAWLFPKTDGCDPRGGSPASREFQAMFPGATTWGEVFSHSTAHLALDNGARIRIWEAFVYECAQLVASIEDRTPGAGFLLDRDDEQEFLLRYLPDADRYVFEWRPVKIREGGA